MVKTSLLKCSETKNGYICTALVPGKTIPGAVELKESALPGSFDDVIVGGINISANKFQLSSGTEFTCKKSGSDLSCS